VVQLAQGAAGRASALKLRRNSFRMRALRFFISDGEQRADSFRLAVAF
jgi:hypothetical protein